MLKSEALSQVNAGADILDINVAVPGTDEAAAMAEAITAVQNLVQVPLCLDSPNPAALEAGLKKYHGKALSIRSMRRIRCWTRYCLLSSATVRP